MRVDQYPIGNRTLTANDYVLGLVTGQLADIPISVLSALIASGGGFWLGGTTAQRPASPVNFMMFFDTTLGMPIWWSGTKWVNSSGFGPV